MKILGIDPGYRKTGYGMIEIKNNNIFYINSGLINSYNKKNNKFNILKFIKENINLLILKYNPNCLAIEQIFIGKNYNSLIKLCYAKALILIPFIEYNIPIFEYNFNKVKKIITGSIKSKKNDINIFVKKLLNINNIYINYDSSDALAIALTHYVLTNK